MLPNKNVDYGNKNMGEIDFESESVLKLDELNETIGNCKHYFGSVNETGKKLMGEMKLVQSLRTLQLEEKTHHGTRIFLPMDELLESLNLDELSEAIKPEFLYAKFEVEEKHSVIELGSKMKIGGIAGQPGELDLAKCERASERALWILNSHTNITLHNLQVRSNI